jgi:hypothetical protein
VRAVAGVNPNPASDIRSIIVPARPAAPRAGYNGSLDAITGVTSAMEFSTTGVAGVYTPSPGTRIPISRISGVTTTLVFHVRIAATATTPASNHVEITVPLNQAPAPDIIRVP